MNKLYVGINRKVELPERRFLYIADEVPKGVRWSRVFDPKKHSFNPLKNLDDVGARELAELIYTLYPQGENTLTVRNGRRNLMQALLGADRFDLIEGDEEVEGIRDDILASVVLKRVLCGKTLFSFDPTSIILARINRAELGRFTALALGLFLIHSFKGQVVVPDFGFYGRNVHERLIRENRLIAGVNYLDELPSDLKKAVLLIGEKEASGALYDDAVALAKFAGLIPQTNEFNDDVAAAMGIVPPRLA